MITILRRMRQNLLTEGKTSKYFKYAIGEISLVVLGILIALQIGSWNEMRKEKELETKILTQMRKDILANITSLDSITNEHLKSKNATISILTMFANPDKLMKVNEIDSLVELSTSPVIFKPKIGFFRSIINTGEIKLIKNQDIVSFINSIEEEIDNVTSTNERLIESWDDHLSERQYQYIRWMSIAQKHKDWFQFQFPESRFERDYKGFFDDAILENMYMFTVYEQTGIIIEEQGLLKSMHRTLSLIDKELY